jgi:hypothetical protein
VAGGGAVKVFERVAGAQVEVCGLGHPSEAVVRVDLDVDGRLMPWFASVAEAKGCARVRVPFATDVAATGNVRVVGATLRAGRLAHALTLPDAAVRAGATVTLP